MICVEGRKEKGWLVGCQRISEEKNYFIYFMRSKVSTTIPIRSHSVEACKGGRAGGEFIREHHQNL